VEISKTYGKAEWREDLKRVTRRVGAEGKRVVLLFSDTQIKDEAFLEDINNMLNAGEVPNMFPQDEKMQVGADGRAAGARGGVRWYLMWLQQALPRGAARHEGACGQCTCSVQLLGGAHVQLWGQLAVLLCLPCSFPCVAKPLPLLLDCPHRSWRLCALQLPSRAWRRPWSCGATLWGSARSTCTLCCA
jgi:hypothetical protein